MNNATAVCQDGPLALICGGGTLPLAVADAAAKRGRDLVLFPISGTGCALSASLASRRAVRGIYAACQGRRLS